MECGECVECKVWSVKCGVGVWSVECEVWSGEGKVWSVKCVVCGVCGV